MIGRRQKCLAPEHRRVRASGFSILGLTYGQGIFDLLRRFIQLCLPGPFHIAEVNSGGDRRQRRHNGDDGHQLHQSVPFTGSFLSYLRAFHYFSFKNA